MFFLLSKNTNINEINLDVPQKKKNAIVIACCLLIVIDLVYISMEFTFIHSDLLKVIVHAMKAFTSTSEREMFISYIGEKKFPLTW